MNTTTNPAFAALWDAPGSTRGFFYGSDAESTIKTQGSDLGGKTTAIGARSVPGLGVVLTLHVEGGTHWAGRGMQRGTHPAHVATWLIERKDRWVWRYVQLGTADLPRNAEARLAKSATYIANVIRTMEVPS